ncbi:MAG: hypothetical protein ACQ5SW_05485 [Sphaerochaetaceae bacterium]
MEDDRWESALLFSVPGHELYFLAYVKKIDNGEVLASEGISEDKSKFFVLITNSYLKWKPYGIGLFVFDLENPENNIYQYSVLVKHGLRPIIEITDKDIVQVELTDDTLSYWDRSGERIDITLHP